MARFGVAVFAGRLALAGSLACLPGRVEAQATGVLQATARVTDYRSSFLALESVRIVTAGLPRTGSGSTAVYGSGDRFQVVARSGGRRGDGLAAGELLVTISYLD